MNENVGLIEEAITEWFGPRCPDYTPGCAACDAWAQLDSLLGRIGWPEPGLPTADDVRGILAGD